jgi:putative ABC transport system permease protein
MTLRRWLAALTARLRWRQAERDLDEEMRTHFEMAVDENLECGMSQSEAHRAARRSFGVDASVREGWRQADGLYWLDTVVQDIRYGIRTLRRSARFTLAAVLTLALGVGMTTAVFSVIDSLLLNGVPFTEPDRLVELYQWGPRGGGPFQPLTMLEPWRAQDDLFDQVEAYRNVRRTLIRDTEPEALEGAQLSPDLLRFLGVQPRLGRGFALDEAAASVSLISDRLWRSRFGADVDIIGRSMRLDDRVSTIIGVMPASFRFPDARAQFWVPLDARSVSPGPGGRPPSVSMVARLRHGLAFDQADERVAALAPQLDPALSVASRRSVYVQDLDPAPSGAGGRTARLQPLNRFEGRGFSAGIGYVQERRGALFVLFGAVAFVLLIACANASNLFLSRTLGRRREFAIRAAAGAGRFRLFRQILTESVVVSVLAGLLGLGFATWMLRLIAAAVPPRMGQTMLNPIDLDWRVVSWAALAALLSGLLASLLPARRAVGDDLVGPIKGLGARRASGHGTLRGGLIAVQSGLAVILLIGALLMGRSLFTLVNVDVGWTAERVVALEPRFQAEGYQTPESRFAFLTQLAALLETLPGVRAVGTSDQVPFLPSAFSFGTLDTDGASLSDTVVIGYQVSRDHFSALDIPVLQGRTFEQDDMAQDAVIVSRDLATRLWPDTDAVGQRVRFDDGAWLNVVGVVGAIQSMSYDFQEEDPLEIYVPLRSPHAMSIRPQYVVAATDGRDGMPGLLKQQVWQLDPELPVSVHLMDDVVSGSLAEPRFYTTLLMAFAVLAVCLAGAGVYAVVAYETNRRTQELGVRVALGATRRNVIGHVLGHSMLLSLAGMAAGLLGAVAVTRFLSSLLYEVAPTDPAMFTAAAVFLLAASLAGGYLPARRATKVDPMVSLRHE